MQELLNSMVKLSAAMTVFGIQQMQGAVGTTDTKESVDKLRDVIDAMAAAVSARIDESRRPVVDRISNLPGDIMDKAIDSSKGVVQNTSDMMKSTTNWVSGMIRPANAPASSEPKSAEEALAASN